MYLSPAMHKPKPKRVTWRPHKGDPGFLITNCEEDLKLIHEEDVKSIRLRASLKPAFDQLKKASLDIREHFVYAGQKAIEDANSGTPVRREPSRLVRNALLELLQLRLRMLELFDQTIGLQGQAVSIPFPAWKVLWMPTFHVESDSRYVMTSAVLSKGTVCVLGAMNEQELRRLQAKEELPSHCQIVTVSEGDILLLKQDPPAPIEKKTAHKSFYRRGTPRFSPAVHI